MYRPLTAAELNPERCNFYDSLRRYSWVGLPTTLHRHLYHLPLGYLNFPDRRVDHMTTLHGNDQNLQFSAPATLVP